MADAAPRHFLGAVLIDEVSLAPGTPEREDERRVAIADLLESNVFEPEAGPGGPYRLRLGLIDGRLEMDISGEGYTRRHLISLQPFRRVVRDYFMVCDSYYDAIRNGRTQQIEALDMGRRGLHNDGSQLLRERLEGKVTTDLETARRLFTLICALHWKGQA